MRASPSAGGSITGIKSQRLVVARFRSRRLAEGAIILTAQGVDFGEPKRLATETRLGHFEEVKRFLIMAQAILRLGQIKVAVTVGRIDHDGPL